MENMMKTFLIVTTCAALLGGISVASADPMNANARMMHKHKHHSHMMMKKKMVKRDGMMKPGMMKRDGMGKM